MTKSHQLVLLGASLLIANAASACEPVVPFMQATVPTLALSGSILVLAMAVVLKSGLFAIFERRLPRLRAAWRMFIGNVLTSFIGLFVAVMIASAPSFWLIGVPAVCLACWLPSRRLVKAAPLAWLARMSPAAVAGIMTGAMVASCVLFMVGQGALEAHDHLVYWTIKLAAILLALFASITLTTVWEEWVIWRLSSRPEGMGFFAAAIRANLYVLLMVMAVPAVKILPKRLKSPDFVAHRYNPVATRTTPTDRGGLRVVGLP